MKRITALLFSVILACSMLFALASCELFQQQGGGSISTNRTELTEGETGLEGTPNAPQIGDWTRP